MVQSPFFREPPPAPDSDIYWFTAGVAYLRGFSTQAVCFASSPPIMLAFSYNCRCPIYQPAALTSKPASGIQTIMFPSPCNRAVRSPPVSIRAHCRWLRRCLFALLGPVKAEPVKDDHVSTREPAKKLHPTGISLLSLVPQGAGFLCKTPPLVHWCHDVTPGKVMD